MKIGVLGGTFDPPHCGHIALARAAKEALQLDEVIFVPANRNPLKRGRQQSPARHRLAMVKLAIEDQPEFSVSDIEIARGGSSYAVDTITQLRLVKPGDYWFVVGSDAVKHLGLWKDPQRLLRLCRLAVAVRPPESPADVISRLSPEVAAKVDIINMPPCEVSATQIRDALRRGIVPKGKVPAKVLQYVLENRLYGVRASSRSEVGR